MSDPSNLKRLLTDVLDEDAVAGFREQSLAQTLRLARRRRHFRQATRAGATIATVALVTLITWRGFHGPSVPGRLEQTKPYVLVHTEPLPPNAIVESRCLPDTQEVTSIATHSVVTTAKALVSRPKEVGDDELLALCSPRPAVLVRQGPHSAELVFVDNVP